jgi:TIR domain
MKVFISWSGPRSREVAKALRDWVPNVIQAAEPWTSEEDIDKGTQWASKLSNELATTTAGIICVTAENQDSPWLTFETGALSKMVEVSRICPYLIDLSNLDLHWPLAQFQGSQANKDDTLKLLLSLNKGLGDRALSTEKLTKGFERWWPDLSDALTAAQKPAAEQRPKRPDREILEEIHSMLRDLSKRDSDSLERAEIAALMAKLQAEESRMKLELLTAQREVTELEAQRREMEKQLSRSIQMFSDKKSKSAGATIAEAGSAP